ncbi:MAG: AAA family ATPase [Planctomycetota bacterium]
MTPVPDPIEPLRAALAVSPDNVPLRLHLATTLASLDRHGEAEAEFRAVLAVDPGNDACRLALAASYLAQDKVSHADVLVELVTARNAPPAEAFVLLARIRLAEKDLKGARTAFLRACKIDPATAETTMAEELGMSGALASSEGEAEPTAASPLPAGLPDPEDDAGQLSDVDFERPDLAFADVGGMDDVKEEISMKVIQPLAHPELFAAYGKKVGGGVLMYGPPGCGKTHLARATAGEAKAAFMSVGIHEVLELWIGSSERNLRRIFEEARRRAPCVLFFDEVDALGAKRSGAANNAGRQIINQFLSELDGVEDANEGLLVLAATNAPWHLDTAFRRPGRFDRLVFVPPPDAAARAAILEVHLRDKPAESIDVSKVAKKTDRFSGADLNGLIDVAVEEKLRAALKTGRPAPLTEKDLLKAAKRVQPTTAEWFATAKNHVLFANDGGSYDDVADYMGMKPRRSQGDDR